MRFACVGLGKIAWACARLLDLREPWRAAYGNEVVARLRMDEHGWLVCRKKHMSERKRNEQG